jgi:release factor glutamine methyltransferase
MREDALMAPETTHRRTNEPERPLSPLTDDYVPLVSDEYAERIRAWHESALAAMKHEAGTGQIFDYLGLTLSVPPQVQPITGMSALLGAAVQAEVRSGDRVLDMGTGCGVNAILAAEISSDVVAVDTNPIALDSARANATRNGVAKHIDFHHSDVFEAVDGVFDLIIFDPPFRWFAPRDLLETAVTDENYRALRTFFRELHNHLAPGGRVLIFFGTSGDMEFLKELIAASGFQAEVVNSRRLHKDGWQIEYVTQRLTVAP